MFDPQLAGYWGSDSFEAQLRTCLEIITENKDKVDGIKISLLDKDKEIIMRRMLPDGVKMYTGDDFNYPRTDRRATPRAIPMRCSASSIRWRRPPLPPWRVWPQATRPVSTRPSRSDRAACPSDLPGADPILQDRRVFLAWLNGFQNHFVMLGGAQAMRPLPYFTEVFRRADECGLLAKPDLAIERMRKLIALYGG